MTIRINAALRHRAPALTARLLAACACALLLAAPTRAAQCGGAFGSFMAAMAQEAQAAGVSRATIDSAFAGVAPDGAVLAFDRRQRGTFRKSFEDYAATRVTAGRIKTGRALLARHAALLGRIERQFGVPPRVSVAIWGLESDFGNGDMGRLPVIRGVATLAHDCRRTDLFQRELIAALQILNRGDLRAWARCRCEEAERAGAHRELVAHPVSATDITAADRRNRRWSCDRPPRGSTRA